MCDAHARAMVKNVLQYNGKYGCDRCDQSSVNFKLDGEKKGRPTYPSVELHLRTDLEFEIKSNWRTIKVILHLVIYLLIW